MVDRVEVEIDLETQKAINSLRKFSSELDKVSDQGKTSFTKMDGALASFAGNLAAGAVIKGLDLLSDGLRTAVTDSIQFEKGLLGVGKTTNILGKDLQQFGSRIDEMSTRLPIATEELLSIAQTAGQLGVKGSDDILKFTETVAKLTRTTNLTEESALQLAQILNLSKNGVADIDRFGAAIVDLGNNFETQEQNLIEISLRVAQATAAFKLGADEIAGLSAAVAAVGGQAEASGTVIGRVFRELGEVSARGGAPLVALANAVGLTTTEVKKLADQNPTELFRLFITSLKNVENSQIAPFLKQFGLEGERVLQLLPSLAQNSDKLTAALSRSGKAFQENSALNKEFAIQVQAIDAQLILLKNNLLSVGRAIFEFFAPAIKGSLELLNNFFGAIKGFSEFEKTASSARALSREIKELNKQGIDTSEKSRELKILQAELDRATGKVKNLNSETDLIRKPSTGKGKSFTEQLDSDFNFLPKSGAKVTPISRVLPGLTASDIASSTNEVGGAAPRFNIPVTEDPAVLRQKELNIEIAKLREEAQLEKDQREATLQAIGIEQTVIELERLRDIELQKLDIQTKAEEAKAKLIKDSNERNSKLKEIQAKTELAQEKINSKFAQDIRKKEIEDEKAAFSARIQIAQNFLAAGINLAREGSVAQRALQSAAALVATYTAANQALSSPPGPPFTLPLVASTIALGLSNVARINGARFEQGGIVGGNSFSGDRVLARVNSGELILNQAQQNNLVNKLGADSETVKAIMNQPIIVQIDGQEIARATRNAFRDGFAIA